MKRIGNLYQQIISVENLQLADQRARKGKRGQFGIILHDRNRERNIQDLHEKLMAKTYSTSAYSVFKIFDPKERDIYRLPYYPDRIVHHAIMNILEPIFVSVFTGDTYSCIKRRGIHSAGRSLKQALRDKDGTKYCLKLDIRKFYPSIDHACLKELLRRKFKDKDLLWLLDEIIDSTAGLPIGNYLSQYFANFYLTYFDHWIKETLGIRCYFRYADDMIFLADGKQKLWEMFSQVRQYLEQNLKLAIKPNYQVFPVEARGIDFVGYVFYHTHTRMRKSIKQNFARAVRAKKGKAAISSYLGWAKHADCKHLIKNLIHETV